MELAWPAATETPELAAGDAHLWAVRLDPAASLESYYGYLASDELERAQRFRMDDPRRRFVVSRAAVKTLLADYLRSRPLDIVLSYSRSGKPYLPGATHLGQLCFNLAHSDDLALIAVVRNCDVGIDVERLRIVKHQEHIAHRYFHSAEARDLHTLASAERDASFLRCWTAKEAVLKSMGTGLSDSLKQFRVPVTTGSGSWVDVTPDERGNRTRCWLQQLAPCDAYVGAVAFVGTQCRIRYFEFRQR